MAQPLNLFRRASDDPHRHGVDVELNGVTQFDVNRRRQLTRGQEIAPTSSIPDTEVSDCDWRAVVSGSGQLDYASVRDFETATGSPVNDT